MESSDLSWLGTKQKRLQSWKNFLETEIQDPVIKSQTATTLDNFSATLTRCWENNLISDQEKFHIADLERELEQLNEEARMRVVAKKSTKS